MFNLPALQELAKEFKLMRQDIQTMRQIQAQQLAILHAIHQKLK
jgi:hypothetical protein